MKCLQIANDFSLTKVHTNLYSHLDKIGITQIVFNPVRSNTPVGNNAIDFKTEGSEIIYSRQLKKYHRVLFRNKINFLFQDLEAKHDLTSIDVIHATTLFSDGALALKAFKKYGIPYIVAARGTDVSLFLKYRPDLIFLMKDILQNASHVIFLSQALKKQFFNNKYVRFLRPDLDVKMCTIFNGIDDFWISNTNKKRPIVPNKILYIGRFDGNKNVESLIEAILALRKDHEHLELDLVGKGGGNEDRVLELCEKHKDFIQYHGPIYNKTELQKVYLSNHIFAMPSHSETFGLVYIEALSQGLPIVCSKNQGIDGSFDAKIGSYVDSKSVDSIAEGIRQTIKEYDSFETEKMDFELFKWSRIANIYSEMYKSTSHK